MLDFNQFSGTVPRALWRLTGLQVLQLHSNKISGSVPDAIGLHLQTLYLARNLLSGTLEVFNSPLLEEIVVSQNQFSGTTSYTDDMVSTAGRITFSQLANLQLSSTARVAHESFRWHVTVIRELQESHWLHDIR